MTIFFIVKSIQNLHLQMINAKLEKTILERNENVSCCSKILQSMSWASYMFMPQTLLMPQKIHDSHLTECYTAAEELSSLPTLGLIYGGVLS